MAARVADLELRATGEPGQWSLRGTGLVLLCREGGWAISTISLNASGWLRDRGPTVASFDRRADAVRPCAPRTRWRRHPRSSRRCPSAATHIAATSPVTACCVSPAATPARFIGVPARWEAHTPASRATSLARRR